MMVMMEEDVSIMSVITHLLTSSNIFDEVSTRYKKIILTTEHLHFASHLTLMTENNNALSSSSTTLSSMTEWVRDNYKLVATGAGAVALSYTGFKLMYRYVDRRSRSQRQQKVDLLLRCVAHQDAEQSLKQLLNICIQIYLHEYGYGNSNHLPSTLIAIHQLFTRYPVSNDTEEIVRIMKGFFISYEPRLRICLSGDYKYESSQNILFENCELDQLISGISGGSFVPFIQYAYSLIVNHEETKKDAICYMQITYQSLDQPFIKVKPSAQLQKKLEQFQVEFTNSIEEFNAVQILNGLNKHFSNISAARISRTKEAIISKQILHVATTSPIYQQLQKITFPAFSQNVDIHYLIERLTTCALFMFVEYGSSPQNISVLYLVTLTHAARLVIESKKLSSIEMEWRLLHSVWQIILATYMLNNMQTIIHTENVLESKDSGQKQVQEWEVIIQKLRSNEKRIDFEHDIELVFACVDQAIVFPQYDQLFRYVSERQLIKETTKWW
jgi:hypothetical protein